MNKPKLISLKDAIVSAFKNLFENASLGFVYKAYLGFMIISTVASLVIAIPLVIVMITSTAKNYKDTSNNLTNQSVEIGTHAPSMSNPYTTDYSQPGYSPNFTDELTMSPQFDTVGIIVSGLLGVLFVILGAIFATLTSLVPVKLHDEDLPSIKALLSESLKKAPKFVILMLLIALITGIGYILLIVPGILFTIWFLFAPYILLKEDVGVFEALKRSKNLSKGYKGNLFLKGLGYAGIMILISLPLLLAFYVTQGLLVPIVTAFTPLVILKIYEDLKEKQGTGNTEENPTPEPTDNVELEAMPEKEEPKEKSKKKKKEKKVKKEKKKKNKSKPKDENPNIPSLTSVNLEENPEVKGSSGEDLPEPENLPEPSKPSTKQVETENSDFIEPVEDAITGEEKSPEVKENTAEKTPDLNIPTTDASLKEKPKMETPKPEEASTDKTKEAQETPQENTGPELNIPDELPEDLQSEPKVESTETKEEAPESTEQQPETSEEQA